MRSSQACKTSFCKVPCSSVRVHRDTSRLAHKRFRQAPQQHRVVQQLCSSCPAAVPATSEMVKAGNEAHVMLCTSAQLHRVVTRHLLHEVGTRYRYLVPVSCTETTAIDTCMRLPVFLLGSWANLLCHTDTAGLTAPVAFASG